MLLPTTAAFAQHADRAKIPAVLHGVNYNSDGKLSVTDNHKTYVDILKKDKYTLSNMIGTATGNDVGILVEIPIPGFKGSVTYGPLQETDRYPTVAFQGTADMEDGKALLDIKNLFVKGEDFYRLQDKDKVVMGYRVMNETGKTIYEGRVAYSGNGPYKVVPTIIEGPMVNELNAQGCVVSFETQLPVKASITVDGKVFSDKEALTHHEILLNGLKPASNYSYMIAYADRQDSHSFRTAPAAGSRKPFTFAYTGASRAATGGGEREFGGVNYQASRAIMALANQRNAAFLTVMGDFTTGGNPSTDGHLLEYTNFKRAFEPFWSKMPVYTGFGNHELSKSMLIGEDKKDNRHIEAFPYQTSSGEAAFAQAFVHPKNGPQSEDGASYDPNPAEMDFPPYLENVYYFTYDNAAFIVMNSDYWLSKEPSSTSGNCDGYMMDQQVKWLAETVGKMEKDASIDHIFVFHHSSVFPNGDHLMNAMWWKGENTSRAWVAGKPLSKGIIERRDEILDILVNKGKKFVGFISGDEHNYSLLSVSDQTSRYAEGYQGPKIKLNRSFYCLNNGAGGSTPYGALSSPWSKDFKYFAGPPVAGFITIEGKNVTLNAINAETLDTVCTQIKLR
ncbi:MAG: hypothetical protein BGO21_05315 [Dyadobacter sp. 50-39]|uniref:metallophosphoesterase family protein n=1 Tax=Dyadobacter sp. 50-39 TaxID=1895756 RepID=UPI000968ACF0|nr:metallophosphoesterase [Dyadobacter sp. 50-39]OJV22576.1 MAG: hypothetical protein BGO21_05315 [Dyadobacter sp. 50-39]